MQLSNKFEMKFYKKLQIIKGPLKVGTYIIIEVDKYKNVGHYFSIEFI